MPTYPGANSLASDLQVPQVFFYLHLCPECGLAQTSLPKNPQAFMHISVQGDRDLWQLQKHPGAGGPCTLGLCWWQLHAQDSWLSAGSGVGGTGSRPRSDPSACTQRPVTRDGLAATSSQPQEHLLGHGGHPDMPEASHAQWLALTWALRRGGRGEVA